MNLRRHSQQHVFFLLFCCPSGLPLTSTRFLIHRCSNVGRFSFVSVIEHFSHQLQHPPGLPDVFFYFWLFFIFVLFFEILHWLYSLVWLVVLP
ncbi:hypothetical protein BJX76DRAFT_177532 [Aspergillus varians]